MMDNKTLNPFLAVWLHPKQAARYLIDHKTLGFAMMIITICTIISLPVNFLDTGEILTWPFLIGVVLVSPFLAILGLFITAFFPWAIGKLFKGTSTYTDMYKVMSLASIPAAAMGPIYLIWFVVSPDTLLNTELAFSGTGIAIFLVVMLLSFALGIWSFVVSVAVVAEAHQFSNWKAFFTLIIPAVIILIFILSLGALIAFLFFSNM